VLDTAASNIDGFLCRDTNVSSTQLNRLPWGKEPFSTLITMIFRTYSVQSLTQFSKGCNVLAATSSYLDGVLSRDTSGFLLN
jgi:hypothetical protein